MKVFRSLEKGVCKGTSLKLRSDHGTQYDSDDFMKEMDYPGLDMSKAYVRSPECNGCIERFNRTINEEVFRIERFFSLEQAQRTLGTFIDNYNREWMIHVKNLLGFARRQGQMAPGNAALLEN